MGLRSLGREVNSERPCTPGSQPEKEREREKENERKNDMGRPSFGEQGLQLDFPKELLYPKLYLENNGRCRVSSPDPYPCQAFFLILFRMQKGLR